MSNENTVNITIFAPAGRPSMTTMQAAVRLAEHYSLGIYLTTAQNLRLTGVPESKADDFKKQLAATGARFKAPGKFAPPRVCIGIEGCNLGLIDTADLSRKISAPLQDREHTKPKVKIGISACALCCSSARTSDIGVVATKKGLDLYTGGKGGPNPVVGRRIGVAKSEKEVVEAITRLISYHDENTKKKQRMIKLKNLPDFPFVEEK